MCVYCCFPDTCSLLADRDSLENLITSHGSVKHVRDGEDVTLSCNYSVTPYTLFWYRQNPRSQPDFLVSITESGDPVKADPAAQLTAKVEKNSKVLTLIIYHTAVSDSALYYCALTSGGGTYGTHVMKNNWGRTRPPAFPFQNVG
uniref:Ig-like domain-containing protein n=1 Tax=Astyanax mexicanus TaxID=7994 RepID=A0A3B1K6E3_ASTMX